MKLTVFSDVPDGAAKYPPTDANQQPINLGPRVIFSSGNRRLLATTRRIAANQGGAVLVSQKSLNKLSGTTTASELNDVDCRAASYLDLLRYSRESLWRFIGALLAAISAAAALIKELAGSKLSETISTPLLITFIVAAVATFAKEILDLVLRDVCAGKE